MDKIFCGKEIVLCGGFPRIISVSSKGGEREAVRVIERDTWNNTSNTTHISAKEE